MTTFTAAYVDHSAFVFRSVRRLGVRPGDVDDVAQDVFVIAHRRWDSFEHRSTVKTWLFGICRKVVADPPTNRAWVRREVLTEAVAEPAVEAEAPALLEQQQARQELDRALDELDEARRATFVLFELEELAMHEVARLTEVPLQTAYSRLYSARRQLTATFERERENERTRAAPRVHRHLTAWRELLGSPRPAW